MLHEVLIFLLKQKVENIAGDAFIGDVLIVMVCLTIQREVYQILYPITICFSLKVVVS